MRAPRLRAPRLRGSGRGCTGIQSLILCLVIEPLDYINILIIDATGRVSVSYEVCAARACPCGVVDSAYRHAAGRASCLVIVLPNEQLLSFTLSNNTQQPTNSDRLYIHTPTTHNGRQTNQTNQNQNQQERAVSQSPTQQMLVRLAMVIRGGVAG